MLQKQITIGIDQLRRIARHELTFNDIDGALDDDAIIEFEGAYEYTLEDLYFALKSIRDEKAEVGIFAVSWLQPIAAYAHAFGIEDIVDEDGEAALKEEQSAEETIDGEPMPRGIASTDRQQFERVWTALSAALDIYGWEDDEDIDDEDIKTILRPGYAALLERPVCDFIDLDEHITRLENYFSNKGRPIDEWRFTVGEMREYIAPYAGDDDEAIRRAAEVEIRLCRRFVDALCDHNYTPALRIKAYACYGGNRMYPCDWPASRDCLKRLFAIDDDPQYANTLGYIYYYGRCSGGVPDYHSAFEYFSYAAANMLYEGMYKLADMYYHGYGCRKSPRTARRLYEVVYNDTLQRFLGGESTNFADAALRMGMMESDDDNPELAIVYYLQALYAARLRAKEQGYFGNARVVSNAQKALNEACSRMPEGYFCDHVDYDTPSFLFELSESGHRCELRREAQPDGTVALTVRRLPSEYKKEPEPRLLVVPRLKLCQLSHHTTCTLARGAELWFRGDAQRVRFDESGWNENEQRCEFYNDGELVAWVWAEHYRMCAEPRAAYGETYRIASVRFGEYGRTYDYICELEDIAPGDRVIVNAAGEEKEVTVVAVTSQRESELALPLGRYKYVLRKAERD